MSEDKTLNDWHVYTGDGKCKPWAEALKKLGDPPEWRKFGGIPCAEHEPPPLTDKDPEAYRGKNYQPRPEEIEMVNAALYLRRPLLVTGPPGAGKSSLAHAAAWELGLGPVLHWPITTRSTIQDGLYSYDAIGRLQESQMGKRKTPDSPEDRSGSNETDDRTAPDVGRYIRLGPLGTALLPTTRPRALLIDEIDKSDIDLPNDLLNVFEEGRFPIQELVRQGEDRVSHVYSWKGKVPDVKVTGGEVVCSAFPFVVLTSNGERELPRPFLRRCVRLDIQDPDEDKLAAIVQSHFGNGLDEAEQTALIEAFMARRKNPGALATDQLLNAVYLTLAGIKVREGKVLLDAVLRRLDDAVNP